MPDSAMGWTPDPPVEHLGKKVDPRLPFQDDRLKQFGDPVPIGRGEPAYPARLKVREPFAPDHSLSTRMVEQESLIQAIQSGETGSLACQADPNCHEPFSPPSDLPFGDIIAEASCDGSPRA